MARVVRSVCRSRQLAKVVTYLLRFVCQWHVLDVLRAVERSKRVRLQRSKQGVEVLRSRPTPGGADAVTTFENRAKLLQAQADANRDLSSDLDHDDA